MTGDSSGEPALHSCDVPVSCDRGVFDGSLALSAPEDIAEIMGYTSISGRLSVSDSDFECLSFLACLESVGHDLALERNAQLIDVTGLDNIAAIGALPDGPLGPGGTLTVSNNAALADFNTLDLLEQTPASLRIVANESLESISGLQAFVGTFDDLEIRLNPRLSDIASEGLAAILFIGGECSVSDNESLSAAIVDDVCEPKCPGDPWPGNGC